RYLYQPLHGVEPSIFPLEIRLGLEVGLATPALTERVGQAAVTSSQNSVLEYLKRNHGVSWSVATLRKVIAGLSEGMEPRLSSLCSFRTLYFTPESGPATEGFSCRGAVMNDEGNAACKIRKLRASRDLWKQRSAEKQQEIRHLRVTVRDLSSSRENWKTRVKELEQQLQAAHQAHAAVGPGSWT